MNHTQHFTSVIEINGVNPYVLVDAAKANALQANWRRPMPVLVKINDMPAQPWHINMMPTGTGDFFLYLHNDVRKASSTKVGDMVDVKIWFDDTYQNGPQHETPDEFENALQKNPIALQKWNALPPSRKKEVLRYMAGLKSTDALQRNIEGAMHALSDKTAHFLGRDWVDGK